MSENENTPLLKPTTSDPRRCSNSTYPRPKMSKSDEQARVDGDTASVSGGAAAAAATVLADDEDASAIKGQLDPVYEAKARVLNRAVG